MKRTFPLLALLFLLPAALLAQTQARASASPIIESAYGEKLQIAGIPNAGKITDLLYRGAQPAEQGLSELKKMGITTIIDLRGEDYKKVDGKASAPNRLASASCTSPSAAGLLQPTSRFSNFSPCSATILAKTICTLPLR